MHQIILERNRMGFFKDIAFETSKKWEIARCYYGDKIAKELYYLPNSEPLSLLTETEKAAGKVIRLVGKADDYDNKHLLKTSDEMVQGRRDAFNEAKEALGADFITMKEAQMRTFGREYAIEKAERFWRHRLELFKKNGSVE